MCYQLFTLLPKAGKHKIRLIMADDEVPSTSKRGRPSFADSSATCSAPFPSDKCLFCDKQHIQVNRKKQILVKCVTPTAEESIKTAAEAKGHEKILCKVRGQDLQARETWYHNCCRRNYTRDIGERHVTHTDSESSQSQAAHNAAFKYISKYIEGRIHRKIVHDSGKVSNIHVRKLLEILQRQFQSLQIERQTL